MSQPDPWPVLAADAWPETLATLHMWTQIVGKVRLVQSPWVNHSWHVTLYVTAWGLTTSPIPHGTRTFQIDFDFQEHRLVIRTSDGGMRSLALRPRSVADLYEELMAALRALGVPVAIDTTPNEVAAPVPFPDDTSHASYDAPSVERFWRALVQTERVFQAFRARYLGKCSPVHFFWGSFDLALTRFSGRPAPPHPGGIPHLPDWVTREAYSHEVSSAGFWPGSGDTPRPIFYSYAYPEPDGFAAAPVRPGSAFYDEALREFVLPYDEVREAHSPDALLLDFLQSTWEAAADRGRWDRASLERLEPPGPEGSGSSRGPGVA